MIHHKSIKNLSNAKLCAIKTMLLVGLILFVPFFAKGIMIIDDSFDTYSNGDFRGQSADWNVLSSSTIFVNDAFYHSWNKSLFYASTTDRPNAFYATDKLTSGSIFVFSKMSNTPVSDSGFFINIIDTSNPYYTYYCGRIGISLDNDGIFDYANFSIYYTINGNIEPPEIFASTTNIYNWNRLSLTWDATAHTIRYGLNDTFTGLLEYNPSLLNQCTGVSDINIYRNDNTPYNTFYFDTFYGTDLFLGCGSDEDCVFCDNQTACENAGCYWSEGGYGGYGFLNQCLPNEPYFEEYASTSFDPLVYYASNSEYSTPTGLYTSLTNVSYKIFGSFSSWISNFSELFDLANAKTKGIEYGEAIPRLRGYLSLFDDLFLLPLGDILFIYLIFLIGIILFRIFRHIKSILPFQ